MADRPDFRVPRPPAGAVDYDQLFCDITEAIWPPDRVTDKLAHIAQGTPGQRALFVTTLFARLVDNGGLAGFFGPGGFYSGHVAEGLRTLGAQDLLEAFVEGLNLLTRGEDVPRDDEARQGLIYSLSGRATAALDSIDRKLYGGSSVEERLYPYFKRYVDAHPQEFFQE